MTKSWLKNCLLLMLAGGSIGLASAAGGANQICSEDATINLCTDTRFYKSLSDDERSVVEHLVHYHRNMMLSMALRAVGVYEKMLATAETDATRVVVAERLSYVSKFIRESIQDATATRVPHGGVFAPLLNCCTPRDAYFREVVTNILTVTGNASVAGNLTVGGNLVITGTVTESNLIVTGTGTFGALVVLSNAAIAGNEAIGGVLAVAGNAAIGGSLAVGVNELIGGTLTVTGSSTLGSLTVAGGTNLNITTIGTLNVSGNETVGGNLTVTGTATVGALSTLSNLNIIGNETIGGTLTVTGSSTLSSLTVPGGSNFGTITASTLNVGCNETVGCNLTVTGTTTTGALSVLSNSAIARNETIGGSLTLTGGNIILPQTNGAGTQGIVQLGGVNFLSNFGTDNVFIGGAGNTTSTFCSSNVGIGPSALASISSSASVNIAIGNSALSTTSNSSSNVAIGLQALQRLSNSPIGSNVAIGQSALTSITSGILNVAIGSSAGILCTGGDSNNLFLSNQGVSGDSNIIRIGTIGGGGGHTQCFIAGIAGVTVANNTPVLINTVTGQLGTVPSSRRYKENIEPMQQASNPILKLSPVTFAYKNDPAKHRQYGLIAEDVYEIFPDLVVCDKEGRPETVRYHDLAVLLLNELKKQNNRLKKHDKIIHKLIRKLKARKMIN